MAGVPPSNAACRVTASSYGPHAPSSSPPPTFRKRRCTGRRPWTIVAWALGTFAFVYFYPYQFYSALERSIVQHGLGGSGSSGIQVNTLNAMPSLASPITGKSNANHDTLCTVGWLDFSKGPQILHVPDMAGRYYSVQFVGPWGDVFAYVGRRTTGTEAATTSLADQAGTDVARGGVADILAP